MKISSARRSVNPTWIQIVIAVLLVIYVTINLFVIGGDAFVFNLNNYTAVPLSIGVTAAAFWFTRRVGGGYRYRLIWWSLTIGWGLWAVAETWWAVEGMITAEVPYPSGADFFYLAGYLPIYLALYLRMRSLPPYTSSRQRLILWGMVLLVLALTAWFVLLPAFQANNPSNLLVSVLNVLYPLLDLVLLVMVLRVFFSYQQGRYARAWLWLSAGFISMTVSDLLFSYLETIGRYYPDGQVNFASTILVDIPYNLSFLIWIIALLDLYRIQTTAVEITTAPPALEIVPNTHLIISTNRNDIVDYTSRNVNTLFQRTEVPGKKLAHVVGIALAAGDAILQDIRTGQVLKERPLTVSLPSGQGEILVSGMAIINPEGDYSGAYILIRAFNDDYSIDRQVSDYDQEIIRFAMGQTGTQQKEEGQIRQLLTGYYLGFLQAFYQRLYSEGGSLMADSFLGTLHLTAAQNGWPVTFPPGRLLEAGSLTLAELRCALPALFEVARQYVSETIDEAAAEAILQEVRSRVDERVFNNLRYFEGKAL